MFQLQILAPSRTNFYSQFSAVGMNYNPMTNSPLNFHFTFFWTLISEIWIIQTTPFCPILQSKK